MENLWIVYWSDRAGREYDSGAINLKAARIIYHDIVCGGCLAFMVNAASGESYY